LILISFSTFIKVARISSSSFVRSVGFAEITAFDGGAEITALEGGALIIGAPEGGADICTGLFRFIMLLWEKFGAEAEVTAIIGTWVMPPPAAIKAAALALLISASNRDISSSKFRP
jgi:hypothetical protein